MIRAPFHRLVWLMPAAFAFHIAEEFTGGFPAWVSSVAGGAMSVSAFLVNNAAFMALLLALTLWVAHSRSRVAAFALIAWASANLFWDFLFHLFAVPLWGVYSPGLVTATLLYFPISFFVARACLGERVLTPAGFAAAAAIGAGIMAFVIWAGLYHFAL